jgi:glycosyltransferase involved in cell wall biosynthesis
MKIIIATTQVPFISGGAEIQAMSLKHALEEAGHLVEIVDLPFKGYPSDLSSAIPYTRLMDLSDIHGHKVDRLIGLKFPSYLIPHPNKVIWLIHQHRDAYDLWEKGISALLHHAEGQAFRELVTNVDNQSFKEARHVFAESLNVAKRLKKFNDFDAPPLYHPPKNEDRFHCEAAQDYLFFPSRLTPLKRQDLVLRALSITKNPVQLVLAGTSDIPSYSDVIKNFIVEMKVQDRVKFLGRITEEEKFSLYSKSLAVVYPPYDEDYGYVTLEAMLSGKPVVTCTDSGGSLEFVKNGETGWIAESTPEALARCFDEIWENRSQAAIRGLSGRDLYRTMGISWKKVIDHLCA